MKSFENFRSILDCIGDPVFIVDYQYRFVFVNNAVAEQSGIPFEKWLGKTEYDVFPEAQADIFRARTNHVFETGEKDISQEQATDADGHVRIIITTKTIYTDISGEKYVVGAIRDITERKRIEEALRESENRYRMLADNATDVIYVYGLDGKYKYVSPSVKKVRGFSPEELIGRPVNCFMTPESVESVNRTLADELEKDKTGSFDPDRTKVMELEMLRKDGSTMWTEIKASFLRNDNGEPTEIIGIARDITERKRTEDALHESETRFRDLVEMLPEIVFELDMDGRVTYANRRMYDLLGYSSEDIESGLIGFEVIAPVDKDRCIERFIKRTKGEELGASEYTALRKGRSTFPALFHLTPRMKGGKLAGLRGILIDITQHKQMEEEEKHSEKLAAALEMAGTICHEFNQPLQSIISCAELLSIGCKDDRINNVLEQIKGQVRRMGIITDKLMGLKRYSSRKYIGTANIADIDYPDVNIPDGSDPERK